MSSKNVVITAEMMKVNLLGEEYELNVTIQGVRKITAAFGGLRPAVMAVENLNYDAVAAVLASGTDRQWKSSDLQQLAEEIWQTPDNNAYVSAATALLLMYLQGGRRPVKDEKKASKKAKDSGKS